MKALKFAILPLVKLCCRAFFPASLFRGRWFEQGNSGWMWTLKAIWFQKILGFNRGVPWPIHPGSKVSNPDNISFHPDNIDNFQSFGCYFQNFAGKIELGRGVYIAPNVGIITANHDPVNPEAVGRVEDVKIGENSWIGMNSVILPGVVLGPGTVVGAGSVVNRSFPEGHCVVAGSPARKIKDLGQQ